MFDPLLSTIRLVLVAAGLADGLFLSHMTGALTALVLVGCLEILLFVDDRAKRGSKSEFELNQAIIERREGASEGERDRQREAWLNEPVSGRAQDDRQNRTLATNGAVGEPRTLSDNRDGRENLLRDQMLKTLERLDLMRVRERKGIAPAASDRGAPQMSQVEELENPLAARYAEEHRRYLKEAMPHVLKDLSESGSLENYLNQIGNQASQMEGHLMAEHNHSKEVQALPHLQRVRELQGRVVEVQEIVRHDLIHQPQPD